MECDKCGERNGSKNPVFPCDSCKQKLCKQCAKLTASEVKVLELKESRILKFNCEKCVNFEQHRLLQNIIEDKASIIEAKEEIITLLRNRIMELEDGQRENKITYSEMVRGKDQSTMPAMVNMPSIIIKPRKQQNGEKTEFDVKHSIRPSDLKIAIRNSRLTKKGEMVINCSNKSDIDIIRKEVERKLTEYEVQVTKLKLPRFKIVGFDCDLDEKQIEQALREQNSFIEDTDSISITYIRENKSSNTASVHRSTVFGECSAELFRKLMSAKKIYVNWKRYPIYEDINITRCYKCQRHYHKAEKCPNNVVCEFCSGDHHVKDCRKEHKKCFNCSEANKKYQMNYNTNHTSSDSECPSYRYLINIVKSKIDYGT